MTEALDIRRLSPPGGSTILEAEAAEGLAPAIGNVGKAGRVIPFPGSTAPATLAGARLVARPAAGVAIRYTSILGGLARVLSTVSAFIFLPSDVPEEKRLNRQPPLPARQPEPFLRCWADGRDDPPIRAFDAGYRDADEDQVALTNLFIRRDQARAARKINGAGDFASAGEMILEGLLSFFYRPIIPSGLGINTRWPANPLGSAGAGKGTAGGTTGSGPKTDGTEERERPPVVTEVTQFNFQRAVKRVEGELASAKKKIAEAQKTIDELILNELEINAMYSSLSEACGKVVGSLDKLEELDVEGEYKERALEIRKELAKLEDQIYELVRAASAAAEADRKKPGGGLDEDGEMGVEDNESGIDGPVEGDDGKSNGKGGGILLDTTPDMPTDEVRVTEASFDTAHDKPADPAITPVVPEGLREFLKSMLEEQGQGLARRVLGRGKAPLENLPNDSTVSRTHAELKFDKDTWHFKIRDRGSKQGTVVIRNGGEKPVSSDEAGFVLEDGDVIKLGKARFVFEKPYLTTEEAAIKSGLPGTRAESRKPTRFADIEADFKTAAMVARGADRPVMAVIDISYMGSTVTKEQVIAYAGREVKNHPSVYGFQVYRGDKHLHTELNPKFKGVRPVEKLGPVAVPPPSKGREIKPTGKVDLGPQVIGDGKGPLRFPGQKWHEAEEFLDRFSKNKCIATVKSLPDSRPDWQRWWERLLGRKPTYKISDPETGDHTLIMDHVYSIESVEPSARPPKVTIVDPEHPESPITMTYETFFNAFTEISATMIR